MSDLDADPPQPSAPRPITGGTVMSDRGPAARSTAVFPAQRDARWIAAVLITTAPLLFFLGWEMWVAPFPINETVSVLETAGIVSDTAGSPHSLSDPILVDFLDPATRSWYRPLYWATWYLFWHATHSLDATLLLFRILEVATPILLVLAFVWHVRPRSFRDYAAATTAIAVLTGTAAFRENLEIPLPMTLVGMLAAMLVWLILEREHRAWHGPALVALIVLAVGYKEQGLVLVPVVLVAWWAGAPGIRRGTVVTVTLLTVAYLAMRFSTTGSWQPFEQDVSIGFETVAASDAAVRFADQRHWVYVYSTAATAANVLFAEPSNGRFAVTSAAREGALQSWQILNVASSTAMTGLILWWAVRMWRRRRIEPSSIEWRVAVCLLFAIAATGALGFNYARDRLGGMAIVFYALAAYYALRELSVTIGAAGRWRIAIGSVAMLVLAACWHVRTIGTVDSVDARTRSAHREWLAKRQQERVEHAGDSTWLRIFDALEEQGLRPVRLPEADYERAASRWLGTR